MCLEFFTSRTLESELTSMDWDLLRFYPKFWKKGKNQWIETCKILELPKINFVTKISEGLILCLVVLYCLWDFMFNLIFRAITVSARSWNLLFAYPLPLQLMVCIWCLGYFNFQVMLNICQLKYMCQEPTQIKNLNYQVEEHEWFYIYDIVDSSFLILQL